MNCKIIQTEQIENDKRSFLIAFVQFDEPESEFEGKKILVYEEVNADWFKRWDEIKPDFSNEQPRKAPLAMFTPTEWGMVAARSLCHFLIAAEMIGNVEMAKIEFATGEGGA